MNLEAKVKEIESQLAELKYNIESATLRHKLLTKSLKGYNKLIEKAKQLEK